jgi:hypothetical protein
MGPTLTTLLAPIAPLAARRVVVFTGPSLSAAEARARLPGAEVRPPIRRGDLPRAVADGFEVAGIIDGTYVMERTASPAEIRAALAQGVVLYGAASLGALRAVELGAEGFHGIGVIHDWYRRGVTIRDDEVVVAMHPETHAALNDPLINLRYACLRAQAAGVLDEAEAHRLLTVYASYHFSDRHYVRLLRDRPSPRFAAFLAAHRPTLDLKRRDALALMDHLGESHLVGR